MKPGRLSLVLRVGGSLALLGFLASRLDWAGLGRHLAAIDARWLVPAAVLSPLCVVLLATRWLVFLRAGGLRPPFGGVLRLLWTGQFLNTFLPGAVGGDVYKAVAVGRLAPGAAWSAGATVVLDRFCALLTLLVLAAVGGWWHRDWLAGLLAGGVVLPSWFEAVAAAGLLAALAGGLWLACSERGRRLRSGRARDVLRTLVNGLQDARTLGLAAMLSLAIHLANFGIFFCLARALGLELAFGQVLLIMPAVLLAAMLPVSVNGHGVRELLLVGYFRWQGIGAAGDLDPAAAAVAVSLLYVANDLLWNLPGGYWLAVAKNPPAPSSA